MEHGKAPETPTCRLGATMNMRQTASAPGAPNAAGRGGGRRCRPTRRGAGAGAQDPWPSLAAQIFDGRAVRDGSAILAIDAPYRAEDAALVPIGIRSLLPADDARRIRGITLVIDENPSPLAAVFSPGPAAASARCPRGSGSIPTPTCTPWPN